MSSVMHILDLPPEILQKIFKCLQINDLYSVRLTCRKFRDAASVPQVLELDFSNQPLQLEELETATVLGSGLLSNIAALNLCKMPSTVDVDDSSDDEPVDYLTVERLQRISQRCAHLRHLEISNYDFGDKVTINDFPQGLSNLVLDCVPGFHCSEFFAVRGGTSMRNLESLSITNCGPIKSPACDTIAMFANLRRLSLSDVSFFHDSDFTRLDGHLPHLEVLQMVDTEVGDKSFQMIGRSFANLRKLTVSHCPRVTNGGFSALKGNHRLEELDVSSFCITDAGVQQVVGHLVNLRVLRLCDCLIGNNAMLSIWQCLPNLQQLKVVPKEQGNITDDGIANVIMHERLVDLQLINVVFTNDGIARLAPYIPGVQRLYVCSCNIGDEGLLAIAENVPHLTQLILNETLITDVGLKHLDGRLRRLEHLEIDSMHLSKDGILPIVGFLVPLRIVDITFTVSGDGIHVRGRPPSRELEFKGQALSECLGELLRVFSGASQINLSSVEMSAREVDDVARSCPSLETLYIYDSFTRDDVFRAILQSCSAVTELHVYNSLLTDAAVLGAAHMFSGKLRKLSIENEAFVAADTIVAVAPFLASLKGCELCSTDFKSRLIIETDKWKRKLSVAGENITDGALEALATNLVGLNNLSLCDTSVTGEGLKRVAPHVRSLTHLELSCEDSARRTSEEMLCAVGSAFPARLRDIVIKGGAVTDDGLLLLNKQLSCVRRLEITNVLVTDAGMQRLASKLASCRTLVSKGNVNVTRDTIRFMDDHLPIVVFILQDDEEIEDDEL